ncbi:hypothetical protein ABTC63_21520, partial [Acinetobacter baumannii]
FYLGDTGGQVADVIGDQEDSLVGRGPKKKSEKKAEPPPGKSAGVAEFNRLFGAGATTQSPPKRGGGTNGKTEKEGAAKLPAGAASADAAT